MKKFTLSIAFALTIAFTGFAQNQSSAATPGVDSQLTEETRAMAQKLSLNEREYITLRNLNQEKIAKTAEVESMYSNDPEMRNLKLSEIDEHFDARLIAVLNPKQKEAYAAYKSSADVQNIAGANEDDRSAEELANDKK